MTPASERHATDMVLTDMLTEFLRPYIITYPVATILFIASRKFGAWLDKEADPQWRAQFSAALSHDHRDGLVAEYALHRRDIPRGLDEGRSEEVPEIVAPQRYPCTLGNGYQHEAPVKKNATTSPLTNRFVGGQ